MPNNATYPLEGYQQLTLVVGDEFDNYVEKSLATCIQELRINKLDGQFGVIEDVITDEVIDPKVTKAVDTSEDKVIDEVTEAADVPNKVEDTSEDKVTEEVTEDADVTNVEDTSEDTVTDEAVMKAFDKLNDKELKSFVNDELGINTSATKRGTLIDKAFDNFSNEEIINKLNK